MRTVNQLNWKMSNKMTRHIMQGGQPCQPGQQPFPNNPNWARYVNRFLMPSLFSETEMKDMFLMTHQDFYEVRDKFVRPYVRAQHRNGVRRKPHRLTADALTCLLLRKMREGIDNRNLGVEFALPCGQISRVLSQIRDHIYQNNDWIQRGRNLHIARNLDALLEEGHQATMRCERTAAMFQQLCFYNERLVVWEWDSTDISIQKSRNHSVQKRTFSTKSNQNCLHKLEACDATGIVVYSTLLAASVTPANTDESTSHYNVVTESRLGLTGGFAKVFCGTQVYRVVNIVDKGFIRYGYDRSRRWGQSQSFLQWATQEQLTHQHFHFFLPLTATDQALDNNLQPAGLPTFGLRRRMTDLQSNSSRIVTASRHHIENSNARLWSLKLSGVSSLVPQQLLKASGTAPTPQLPIIFIWHKVMDAVYRRK